MRTLTSVPVRRPPAGHPRLALAALTTGTFLYVTAETLPIGLIGPISRDLNVPEAGTGLLVTYYGLVVIVASLPLTHLTRNVDRKRLLAALFLVLAVSALLSAAAPTYLVLLATRVVTALSQALFWSVVVPVAAGLVREEVRGRVVSLVLGGGALAAIVGVPLGTWAGQQFSWRGVFVALAGLGLAAGAVVVTCQPPPGAAGSADLERGSSPDRRRFWVIVALTVLGTTGAFVFFTYVSPFLTRAAMLPAGLLGVVLLLRGLGGLIGVAAAGPLVERRPRLALRLPLLVQTLALALLFAWPGRPELVVVLVALTGFANAAFTTPLATRALVSAPGRVDLAASTISTAVNVGITLGALLGSAVLTGPGARATALVGAALTLIALLLTRFDRPPGARPHPAG